MSSSEKCRQDIFYCQECSKGYLQYPNVTIDHKNPGCYICLGPLPLNSKKNIHKACKRTPCVLRTCGHVFHNYCIRKTFSRDDWLAEYTGDCPICEKEFCPHTQMDKVDVFQLQSQYNVKVTN